MASLTQAQAPAQQDTSAPHSMNEGVIHDTARMGTREEIEKLLKATPSLRDARTPLGALPMLLLKTGADPLLKNNDGRDVLSRARKVRADELAGEVSLWILKGCKPVRPC